MNRHIVITPNPPKRSRKGTFKWGTAVPSSNTNPTKNLREKAKVEDMPKEKSGSLRYNP